MKPNQTRKRHKPPAPRPAVVAVEACEGRAMFSTYTVTTSADAGGGSLRQAIKDANAHRGADVIQFKIGAGAKTIYTGSTLPFVTGPVTIDASTQPGYAGRPLVELRGKGGGYGLALSGGSSTVKGLAINNYSTGILLHSKGGNTVKGCYLGVGLDGNTDRGNNDKGIIVQTAGNTIGGTGYGDRNVISGNAKLGVQFYTHSAKNNRLINSYVGTNAAGNRAVPNGTSGVGVYGAPNNTIGGTKSAYRNVISGNKQDGIVVNQGGATGTLIQGNYIGTDATGNFDLGNGTYGVETSQPNTTVGGSIPGGRNVISGNNITGVALWLGSSYNNVVYGNYIGTDAAGKKDIGNSVSGIDVTNGSSRNRIEQNLISGNDRDGIMLYQGSNNTIKYNVIGWDAAKKYAIKNSRDGIRFNGSRNATVHGNFIGNNGAYAMFRSSGSSVNAYGNAVINDKLFNL